MAYLLDTSVLVRLANFVDVQYPAANRAVMELHRQHQILHICPQNIIEFWNVATRPASLNGLGLSADDARAKAAGFETTFSLLVETPDIYPAWKQLVTALGVVGKQVHDARLVAVCHAHGISHLLTFNGRHFARFAAIEPGVVIVDPANC